MKQLTRLLLACVVVGFIGLLPVTVNAQQNQNRIYFITTVDYPGAGNSTTPFGINDRGDIAGDYVDSSNVRRGFVRYLGGSFVQLVAPGDTGNFTRGQGINNSRTVSGDFLTAATNTFHGYLWRNGVFTQFDIGGPFSTDITAVNDNGDFCGAFGSNAQPNQGFVNIGGTSTVITIPGAYDSQALGINNANRVVGSYRDSGLVSHGFIRNANGTLTYPVDFPGAASTVLVGINDRGLMVGRYTDASGREHGFFRRNPTTFVSFDFPNSSGTALSGINDLGFIVGRYTDSSGLRHGLVAWVWAF